MKDTLHNIGATAGEIYQLLQKEGPMTLNALKKQLKNPQDIIPMSVGWLARENKLSFMVEGRKTFIHIK